MKRRAGEVKRPTKLNKIASQASLGIVRKPLPVWVIDGVFEDHPDADSDRHPRHKKTFPKYKRNH
jgi:hypothetical protein|tara:strand:+ start:9646 stop:9840 length:195 start_codon:yes stop_codon:yes gene_type:complete